MNNLLKIFLVFAVYFSSPTSFAEDKKYDLFYDNSSSVQTLNFTSRDDKIIIKKVVLNRGKCDVDNTVNLQTGKFGFGKAELSKKLEFSETLSIRTNCQKILEAVIYLDSQVDNYKW